jgi:hypothetical protein
VPEIVAIAVAVAALFAFRHYAARQVIARRGNFVWAFAFPMVLGPALIVWAGLSLLSDGHAFGGVMLISGLAIGTAELMFFRRSSQAISAAPNGQDLGEALVKPTADFMLLMTAAGLIFAIACGVALVVWAVLNQGK